MKEGSVSQTSKLRRYAPIYSPNMGDLHRLWQPRRPRGVHVEDGVGRLDLRGHPLRLRLAAASLDLLVEKEGSTDGRRGGRQVEPGAGETVEELKLVLFGRLQLLFNLLDRCE